LQNCRSDLIVLSSPQQQGKIKAAEETTMTQSKVRFASFEEYLTYDDGTENRYELVNGELFELPPESPENDFIANHLFLLMAASGVSPRLIRPGKCEIQVPVLQLGDAANRYPDLVVLRSEHLDRMGRRLTITLEMPPPQMVVEVVSPGRQNHDRDYNNKLAQYQAIGVDEYWIVDPSQQLITVFKLETDGYVKVGEFREGAIVPCATCPALQLTAVQVLSAG
jgi:Uma2 family endonuclease